MCEGLIARSVVLTTCSAADARLVPRRPAQPRDAASPFRPDDWTSVREQFALTHAYIHMAMFLLASHPRPVADAIERHRRAFDENPAGYFHEQFFGMKPKLQAAAAEYMGGDPANIALTDSTTMGLGLVYGNIRLRPGDEALYTAHCHYSTQTSFEHRSRRDGVRTREITLYADPATTSVDEIVANTRKAITDRTRVFAVTWVHSGTGVKVPLAAMAAAIREVNASRDPDDRVLFCVDGVHGFGIEDVTIDELGCDIFCAGTHKWIFGPRGTGVIWARPDAWKLVTPVIPSFGANYGAWLGLLRPDQVPVGDLMTPGGFHSFEHRWALPEAFRFHLQIGKSRVQRRIHELNTMTKEAMAKMPHVKLHTPLSADLSAGIICFEVDGYQPEQVVEHFLGGNIIASTSPYRISYARLSPSLINNEREVEARTIVT